MEQDQEDKDFIWDWDETNTQSTEDSHHGEDTLPVQLSVAEVSWPEDDTATTQFHKTEGYHAWESEYRLSDVTPINVQ